MPASVNNPKLGSAAMTLLRSTTPGMVSPIFISSASQSTNAAHCD